MDDWLAWNLHIYRAKDEWATLQIPSPALARNFWANALSEFQTPS